MAEDREKKFPACFGCLEKVFPLGRRGLRETPDACMYHCSHKTSCLKRAMGGVHGLGVKEEMVERGEKAGNIGFFQRWSRKKNIHRQKTNLEKQK